MAEVVRAHVGFETIRGSGQRQAEDPGVVDQHIDAVYRVGEFPHAGQIGQVQVLDRHVAAHRGGGPLRFRDGATGDDDAVSVRREGAAVAAPTPLLPPVTMISHPAIIQCSRDTRNGRATVAHRQRKGHFTWSKGHLIAVIRLCVAIFAGPPKWDLMQYRVAKIKGTLCSGKSFVFGILQDHSRGTLCGFGSVAGKCSNHRGAPMLNLRCLLLAIAAGAPSAHQSGRARVRR